MDFIRENTAICPSCSATRYRACWWISNRQGASRHSAAPRQSGVTRLRPVWPESVARKTMRLMAKEPDRGCDYAGDFIAHQQAIRRRSKPWEKTGHPAAVGKDSTSGTICVSLPAVRAGNIRTDTQSRHQPLTKITPQRAHRHTKLSGKPLPHSAFPLPPDG